MSRIWGLLVLVLPLEAPFSEGRLWAPPQVLLCFRSMAG